jgi:hypothetical protein
VPERRIVAAKSRPIVGKAAFGVTRKIIVEMATGLLQSFPIATEHLKSCHPALNPTDWLSKIYFTG